jgi:hypothetical protein
MNLDTNRLKTKIQKHIVRANERVLEIQEEMQRLQSTEIPRMQQELATIDALERIAGDYETFPEAGLLDSARRSVEKLGAEIGIEIPPPPASAAAAAEQDQFFAQWR